MTRKEFFNKETNIEKVKDLILYDYNHGLKKDVIKLRKVKKINWSDSSEEWDIHGYMHLYNEEMEIIGIYHEGTNTYFKLTYL